MGRREAGGASAQWHRPRQRAPAGIVRMAQRRVRGAGPGAQTHLSISSPTVSPSPSGDSPSSHGRCRRQARSARPARPARAARPVRQAGCTSSRKAGAGWGGRTSMRTHEVSPSLEGLRAGPRRTSNGPCPPCHCCAWRSHSHWMPLARAHAGRALRGWGGGRSAGAREGGTCPSP